MSRPEEQLAIDRGAHRRSGVFAQRVEAFRGERVDRPLARLEATGEFAHGRDAAAGGSLLPSAFEVCLDALAEAYRQR